VLLAEFELWHSRPIAPTRRIALGRLNLPIDPAPGFGGVLLGAVLAHNIKDVDEELMPDIQRLITEIEKGSRVVQPRLRHRFQADRHGLGVSTHRMLQDGDTISFDFATGAGPLQNVLAVIYVLERMHDDARASLVRVLRKSLTWRGPMGATFVNYVVGTGSSSISAIADPRAWALDVLGFPGGTIRYSKRDVMKYFRDSLRNAHPDHGGSTANASRAINDITEARRVLLEAL
jgi:hypothetical protein